MNEVATLTIRQEKANHVSFYSLFNLRNLCELGLAFLPEPMAVEAIRNRQIIQIQLREEIPERQICMVYDRQRPIGTAAQTLRRIITGEATLPV